MDFQWFEVLELFIHIKFRVNLIKWWIFIDVMHFHNCALEFCMLLLTKSAIWFNNGKFGEINGFVSKFRVNSLN